MFSSHSLFTICATLQMFTNISAYCRHLVILVFNQRWSSALRTCSCSRVPLAGLFFRFVEMGMACLDWVGSSWVVEGNRQLEMEANVECEELGCVVGGPFKPNKLREVRGLVWRPWINKPSEMTMRCADICHHTSLASKHKPPKPSLLPSPFHVLYPTWYLSRLPLSLSSPVFSLSCLYLHFSELVFFLFMSQLCSPPSSFLHFISPQRLHPSSRSSMHGWLSVRGSVCAIGRATEPLWHSAVSQQQRHWVFRPTECLFFKTDYETAHATFSLARNK